MLLSAAKLAKLNKHLPHLDTFLLFSNRFSSDDRLTEFNLIYFILWFAQHKPCMDWSDHKLGYSRSDKRI